MQGCNWLRLEFSAALKDSEPLEETELSERLLFEPQNDWHQLPKPCGALNVGFLNKLPAGIQLIGFAQGGFGQLNAIVRRNNIKLKNISLFVL